MGKVAANTAYYLNQLIPAVALISKGVRLPAGAWMRIVSGAVSRHRVELMLAKVFPDLKGKVLTFVSLSTDREVEDFERSLMT